MWAVYPNTLPPYSQDNNNSNLHNFHDKIPELLFRVCKFKEEGNHHSTDIWNTILYISFYSFQVSFTKMSEPVKISQTNHIWNDKLRMS